MTAIKKRPLEKDDPERKRKKTKLDKSKNTDKASDKASDKTKDKTKGKTKDKKHKRRSSAASSLPTENITDLDLDLDISSTRQQSGRERRAAFLASQTNGPDSVIVLETFSLYLPIPPICQDKPETAVSAQHLSPLLLTYHLPFRGVVLAYENVRLNNGSLSRSEIHATVTDAVLNGPSEPAEPVMSTAITSYGPTFVWVTVDFLLFRPRPGVWMEGGVVMQSKSHIGLVCWNLFNVRIDRAQLPYDWTWVPAEETGDGEDEAAQSHRQGGRSESSTGHYLDEEGNVVDGSIAFKVLDFESVDMTGRDVGILSIEGSLLE